MSYEAKIKCIKLSWKIALQNNYVVDGWYLYCIELTLILLRREMCKLCKSGEIPPGKFRWHWQHLLYNISYQIFKIIEFIWIFLLFQIFILKYTTFYGPTWSLFGVRPIENLKLLTFKQTFEMRNRTRFYPQ